MFSDFKKMSEQLLSSKLFEGKVQAFEEIYRRFWLKLYNIAFQQTGCQEDAEELVQNVFLSIWNRRDKVLIKNLDLYLTLSIKNQVYDFIKSQINIRKYKEYLIFQEINQNSHEIINYTELLKATEEALNRIPEKSAEIFRKSRFENQSIKEIAQELLLSEKAVEYHITKSLKFLRENLNDFYSKN